MCPGPTVVLASASERRRALLADLGVSFRCVSADIDESRRPGEPPRDLVRRLAEAKARAVAVRETDADLVLGADTIAVAGREILGKPADREDARRILRLISGDRHRVLTGVALLDVARGSTITDVVETGVLMRPLSDREIDAYVESGEADGKAGAYAIQETADRFVTSLDGSFTNVVGLPLERLREILEPYGLGEEKS